MTTKVGLFDTSKMPKARRFMESTAKELMYSGSFGAGKSRVGCEKGFFLSLKYPGNKGLIIRKTFASLKLTTMDTWTRYVCLTHNILSFPKNPGNLCTLVNGSQVYFLGLNDDPTRIGSLEVGWIFMDEAIEFTEDEYVMLQGRLRLSVIPGGVLPFRQMMMATNPDNEQHFLYKKFFIEQDPDREVIEANSLDNPYNPQDYTDNLMKLKGRYKERYVLGQWIGFEGLVYDNIDIRTVVVEPFDIPSHWQRYCTIDFGYTNPFVHQWWALCPEDEATEEIHDWYMYREIYFSHRIVEQHAPLIKGYGDWIEATFADHDAEDRATLEEKQILTSLADKAVGPGIQTCYEMFGDNGIHFFADCTIELDSWLIEKNKPTSTVEEFGNYRWAPPRLGLNAKEKPVDHNNHGMDAMRYLFYTLLGIPEVTSVIVKKSTRDPMMARDWGSILTARNWRSL